MSAFALETAWLIPRSNLYIICYPEHKERLTLPVIIITSSYEHVS